jgi:hypothetical protein
MSVLALALKRLELSHGTVPKDCPAGTAPAKPDLECPTGTSRGAVPVGHPRERATNGTFGAVGTNGTLGTSGTSGPVGTPDTRSVAAPPFLPKRVRELNSCACPEGMSAERWERLREGAVRFAAEWADKALSLGWTEHDLFAFAEPFANVSLQGAAWFVGDSTVTAVTADAITLRRTSGSVTRIYRHSARKEPAAAESRP